MTDLKEQKVAQDALTALGAGDSRALLENQLREQESRLKALPVDSDAADRARVELEIAQTLLELGETTEASQGILSILERLIQDKDWAGAVRACEIFYLADQKDSISALAQGTWLAITYPIEPQLTVDMLHHIVDETPDDSDGGAVAAIVAHYIVGQRANDEQHDSLAFLTTQKLAQVAKRHRGIEDQESIEIWLQILELDSPEKFLPKMAKIIDVLVGESWWFDRDELRAQLPVN